MNTWPDHTKITHFRVKTTEQLEELMDVEKIIKMYGQRNYIPFFDEDMVLAGEVFIVGKNDVEYIAEPEGFRVKNSNNNGGHSLVQYQFIDDLSDLPTNGL